MCLWKIRTNVFQLFSSAHCEPAEPSFSPWVKLGKVGQRKQLMYMSLPLICHHRVWGHFLRDKRRDGSMCIYTLMVSHVSLGRKRERKRSSVGLSMHLIYLVMISLLGSHAAKMFGFFFIFSAIALHDLVFPSQRAIDLLQHLCRPRSEIVNTFVPFHSFEHCTLQYAVQSRLILNTLHLHSVI